MSRPAKRTTTIGHGTYWGLLFCLLAAAPAAAQTEFPAASNLHQWGAITLFHGLPSDHVRAIAQTPDGALWFGTDNGLARYDGRRVQKTGAGKLGASRVLALILDDDGGLWMGTSAGAARVIDGAIHPIAATEGKSVTAIVTAGRGRAYLATDRGEVLECAGAREGPVVLRSIGPQDHWLLRAGAQESLNGPPIEISSLTLTNASTLVIGTHSRGLLTLNLAEFANSNRSPDFIQEIKSQPRAFFVEALEQDHRGQLWYGADAAAGNSGLYDAGALLRPDKIPAATGGVTALHADAEGAIWAGTESRGALVVHAGSAGTRIIERFTFESTGGGLLSNRIHAVFVDREGVVWFGTDGGACRYDPRGLHVETVSLASESNFVRALLQSSSGTLWSGTNRGLFVRAGDSDWLEVAELHGRIVHSLAEVAQQRVFVGAASGLFAAPLEAGQAGTFVRIRNAAMPTDNIRAIRVFKDSVYIANYGTGIERVDGFERVLVWPTGNNDGIAANAAGGRQRRVASLHADGEHLWIGTSEDGVFAFDGTSAAADPALAELSGASVWSIAGSRQGVLWFATARGLYAYSNGALIRAIANIDARAVAVADGSANQRSAWCGAVGGGVYRVTLDGPGNAALIAQIDSEQGLPSQSVFSILRLPAEGGGQADRETLWIGTSRGVARYEPGSAPPILNLTRVLGKRVYAAEEVRAGLELEYPQNSLALDVAAASSRTFPEQFQYAFSVLDAAGLPIQEKISRDAQLLIENLKPGRYRVAVGAFTKDLVASSPLRFEFIVAPAPFPWTSTALAVLLALALVAMGWGYRQNSRLAGANRTLATTNAQLAETRLQLANETETERRRIARDLHDQTLADLRRLIMLADRGPVQPAALRTEIESVSMEIRRICEDLSPSALANVGLAAALEWALAEAAANQPPGRSFEYQCELNAGLDEQLELSAATTIQIYRIAQEALSNICRHAAASRVNLTLAIDSDGALLLGLEDNGTGFDASHAGPTGRGLANIRSRASLIDATVTWTARSGGGTTFTLRRAPR